MNAAVRFFYDNAGSSYQPATETPEQGKVRGARRLAAAERLGRDLGLVFTWVDDWGIGDHVKEFDCYDEQPTTCEYCVCTPEWDEREVLASLGCVDDATDEYRRVVEAELADEAISDMMREAKLHRQLGSYEYAH